MITIPSDLQELFAKLMSEKAIPDRIGWQYKKWLRYYLDFCSKYNFPPAQKGSLARFLNKLKEKNQTKSQQEQAMDAVRLYYQIAARDGLQEAQKPAYANDRNKAGRLRVMYFPLLMLNLSAKSLQ